MRSEQHLLGDVCKFIDYRGKTPPKTDAGIPLITAKIIKHGTIQEPQEFIEESFYDEWMRRGIPQKGDIIITTEAPLGEVAQIKTDEKLAFAQRIIILEPNCDILNQDYLLYALQDVVLKTRIEARSTGTTVFGIKASELKKVVIDLPPIDIQKKIGNILSVLDEKIETNNAINKNLEEQAQAIFKAWFMDFEPFDGEMPSDWTYRTLGDIATVSSGKRPPMKSDVKTKETHIPIVGASSVMGFTNEANHSDKILVIGRVGTHGIVQRFNRPCWTSDNTLVLTSQHYEYVYQILRTIDYASLNRGSTQPLITQSDIKKLEILLPTESIARNFEGIVEDLMLLHEENISENEKLSNLRDALLPRLMSGEIDVSGIEI